MERFYTRWELCHELGINKSTWWNYEKKGKIPKPSLLVGRRLFFSEAEKAVLVEFWGKWKAWHPGNMKDGVATINEVRSELGMEALNNKEGV